MSINTKDELSAIPGNCTAMVDVFTKQSITPLVSGTTKYENVGALALR
jgi:hypothetical protein